jgi:hypothetical protein
MAEPRAEQLLNRLIAAVDDIRSTNNHNETNQNRERNESVESEINRLFPSVAAVRQNNQTSQSTRRSEVADPDCVHEQTRSIHHRTMVLLKAEKSSRSLEVKNENIMNVETAQTRPFSKMSLCYHPLT